MTIKDQVQEILDRHDLSNLTDQLAEELIKALSPYVYNCLRSRARDPEYVGLIKSTIWLTLKNYKQPLTTRIISYCVTCCRNAMEDHKTSVVRVPRRSYKRMKEAGRLIPDCLPDSELLGAVARTEGDSFDDLLDAFKRADLDPMEAVVFKGLIKGYSVPAICKRINKSQPYIYEKAASLRRKLSPIAQTFGYHVTKETA